ncbi:MAG: hypothetical protein ACYDC2_01910 [Solirubrobacteraceae bacterium]
MLKLCSWPLALLAVLTIAACGSSGKSSPGSAAAPSPSAAGGGSGGSGGTGGSGSGSGALAADATSAATGDIPDTQNFLTLNATRLGVSMLYPEGWTIRESAASASIADKNNLVRIVVAKGAAPSASSVAAQLAALERSTPGLKAGAPQQVTLASGPALKATYTTISAPNPVTGKQIKLIVDRYVLGRGGRTATIDLGTPVGVDNVDAYRKMIESLKWR